MDKLNPQEDEERRRLIAVSVDPQQLLALIVHGEPSTSWTELQFEGVPEGSVVVGHGHSLQSNCFVLVVHHPSFDVVPPGQVPPMLIGRVAVREPKAVNRLVLPKGVSKPKVLQ